MAVGTTAAILAASGIGSSLISGIFGKKSADSASKIQADAAAAAGKKVEDVTGGTEAAILEAAKRAGTGVTTAAEGAASGVAEATGEANKLLDPYSKSGAEAAELLRLGLVPGSDFNKIPTMADLEIDPGYAFRLKEGQAAIERSAAARGGVMGGAALKDLTTFAQGTASQEYQSAFERFRKTNQDRFDRLFGVSGRGMDASALQGSNLIGSSKYGGDVKFDASKYGGNITTDAAEFAGATDIDATNRVTDNRINAARTSGDYLTQGANARAAGKVAGTNAITGALSGGVNSVTNAVLLGRLLKDPVNKIAGYKKAA